MSEPLPESESTEERQCARCKHWFSIGEFYPKRKQNGLQSYCRGCFSETSHTWAINNRARRAAYARKYRRLHEFNRVWKRIEEQQHDKRI